jgi:hypothetical protein
MLGVWHGLTTPHSKKLIVTKVKTTGHSPQWAYWKKKKKKVEEEEEEKMMMMIYRYFISFEIKHV